MMKMHQVVTKFGILLTFAVVTIVAVGPSANAQDTTAQAASIKGDGGKVRVLFNPLGTQAWPVYAMRKYGLANKYGFELQTVSFATPQASITNMQSGGADIGVFGWSEIARMRNAGIKIVGIAPALRWANFVLVPTESSVQNLGELKGKKVGVDSRNNVNWLIIRAVAQKVYQLNVEKDFIIQEAGMGLLRGLQEQGKLDATVTYNSFMPAMVGSGKLRVLTTIESLLGQLGPTQTPSMLYAAETNFAAANPRNVKAFLAALQEATEKLRTDDAIWGEHAKDVQVTDEKVLALLRDGVRQDLMTRFTPTSEAQIKTVFDVLLAASGPQALGMSQLPEGFMTLDYQ
ncbi:MAG: NitT/TauT family transport system substrate-binding protein [Alphaproteobacteria bacterium]|nr:NitT/TauT family transport system substrate-binding protein [Alphaproteobacteria bacterium]